MTIKCTIYFSEIGDGWGPAVPETLDEYKFIRKGQKSFHNSVPYWIGGSTNSTLNETIEFSDYITNTSGTRHM